MAPYKIDFNKVALEAGYKDAKNARTMFSRLKKSKLDGAGAGTPLPKPTTSAKKSAGSGSTATKKSGNGIVKVAGGGGGKGRRPKKAAKAAANEDAENGGAVNGDTEMGRNDEEDGSGDESVKKEHGDGSGTDEGMDSQHANGFTAINHASVSEADELADGDEA